MTGIRIEGTKEYIEEALRRLRSVFSVTVSRDEFYEKKNEYGYVYPDAFYYYIRAYPDKPDSIFNMMEAYKRQVDELTEELAAAQSTIERLRQKLGEVPQAKRGDMVLSPRHRNEN